MKNLKRILSLALASVMVMGMMVVGASATSFKDDEGIENKAAVETMTALGIISGRDDGSFDPQGTVTRAEMAKMIAFALNGGKEVNFGLKNNRTFPDVEPTDWFAEYVEYCVSLGIIGGRSDGTFDPYSNVTGQEAAKMMLVALGYDADIFGFTGSKWATNVDAYASTLTQGEVKLKDNGLVDEATPLSLYTNVAGARTLPLTRDDAAQLIYNGLNANTVTATVTGIQNGAPLYTYDLYSPSLLESKFRATVATGTLESSTYEAKTGVYTYAITPDNKNETNIKTTKSTIDVTESFKRSVRVVYRGTGAKMEVLAISSVGVLDTSGVVGTAKFKTDDDNVTTLNGTELAADVEVLAFNGSTINGAYVAPTKDAEAHFDLDVDEVNAWDNFSVILNAEGKIATIVVYPSTVETVTDVKNGVVTTDKTTKGYTIEATKPEKVNATTEDELAKGDYLLTYAAPDLPTKLVKQAVIENVTATAESKGVYTIGGVKYTLENDQTIVASGKDSELGKDFNLVVVNGFVVIAARTDGEKSASIDLGQVIYAIESGKEVVSSGTDALGNPTASVHKVRVAFTDGKIDIIDVVNLGTEEEDGKTVPKAVSDSNKVAADALYTFTEEDGKYSLLLLVESDSTELGFENAVKNDVTSIQAGGKAGTVRFDNDAVLFVKYNNGKEDVVEVMSGADVNGWKSTATVSSKLFTNTSKTTGLETVGFGTIIVQNEGGDVTNLPGAQDLVGNYGYLVSNATNVWNPEAKATQKQITLWNGAEDVTYFVDAKVTEDLSAGTAIEFTLNGNVITSVTLLNKAENAKAVAACDGSVIYFTDDNSKEYALEDATVIYIDGKEIEGKATGEIKLAGKDESGKDVANVFFKASTDGKKVAVLFVDVNNAVAVQEDVTPPETNKHEHSYTWTIETEGEHKDEHKGTCTSKTGTCNAETIYHAVPTKNDDKVDGCSECTKLGDLDTPAVTYTVTVTATVGDGSNGVDNGKVKLAAVFAASDSSDVSSATYAWDNSINETTAEVTIEAPQAETTYKCTVTFDGETYEGSATVTP